MRAKGSSVPPSPTSRAKGLGSALRPWSLRARTVRKPLLPPGSGHPVLQDRACWPSHLDASRSIHHPTPRPNALYAPRRAPERFTTSSLHPEPHPVTDDHRRSHVSQRSTRNFLEPPEYLIDLGCCPTEETSRAPDALGQADDPGGVHLIPAMTDDLPGEAEAPARSDLIQVVLLRPRGRSRLQSEPLAAPPPRIDVLAERGIHLRSDDSWRDGRSDGGTCPSTCGYFFEYRPVRCRCTHSCRVPGDAGTPTPRSVMEFRLDRPGAPAGRRPQWVPAHLRGSLSLFARPAIQLCEMGRSASCLSHRAGARQEPRHCR